jgi:hypothetical protein
VPSPSKSWWSSARQARLDSRLNLRLPRLPRYQEPKVPSMKGRPSRSKVRASRSRRIVALHLLVHQTPSPSLRHTLVTQPQSLLTKPLQPTSIPYSLAPNSQDSKQATVAQYEDHIHPPSSHNPLPNDARCRKPTRLPPLRGKHARRPVLSIRSLRRRRNRHSSRDRRAVQQRHQESGAGSLHQHLQRRGLQCRRLHAHEQQLLFFREPNRW